VVHGASCVTDIDLRIPWALLHHENPPTWIALEGQGKPQGVIDLQTGQLHHTRTHRRSLLIQWKDRVPNRSVRTIRGLRCQLRRFDFGGDLAA
jgi:hypothetical protein